MNHRYAFFVVLLLFGTVTLASAQRVMVVPPLGSEALQATAGELAAQAVLDELQEEGFDATRGHDSVAQTVADCPHATCLTTVLRAQAVDVGAVVAVWARAGQEVPYEASVTLLDQEGQEYAARFRIEEGDVAQAARQALAAALASFRGEGRVFVRIGGTPLGAGVTVDGRPVGRLPVEIEVEAGEHVLTISQQGYRSERRTFLAQTEPDGSASRLSITLERTTAESPSSSGRMRRIWGGLLLGAGSALSVGALTFAMLFSGECKDMQDGSCQETWDLEVGSLLGWAGAGLALAVGGLALTIMGKKKRETRVSLRPFALQFEQRF